MKKLMFDTKAIIAFFNNEKGADVVEKLLAEVDCGKAEGYISAITLTEIYYLYSRRVNVDTAKKRVEMLEQSNLKIVPLDERIAVKAGEYKASSSIPVADAIIGASAYFAGAEVVTDDEDFEKMRDVKILKFR